VRIVVLATGKVRGPLAVAVADYEERAGRYWKLEVVEVEAGAPGRNADPGRVMEAEGERLLARLPEGLSVYALTRDGKGMGSRTLARALEEHAVRADAGVAFLIGGAFGLSGEVMARADRRLSLSAMTLPHEMARLVLAEQLYRAGTILRREPYHKGA
jgi:23S rRNA (pseudouridine1915-N3)-methyltransferase